MIKSLRKQSVNAGLYTYTKKALKECTSLNPTSSLLLGLMVLAPNLAPSVALANPQGGNVVGGSATITGTPDELQIHQSSDRAIIEWSSFDINAGETTRFYQPSTSSVALNRVVNNTQVSQINGNLIANGKVMVINPNGVIIGAQGNVDVNSFVATSADIDNDQFMNSTGAFDFSKSGNANAVVENHGTISVADAGIAALVAPTVRNSGVIQGNLSKVQLAAADKFGIDFYGDGLISFAVDAPTGDEQRKLLAENSGSLIADGGSVLMTAAAASDVVSSAINNTGTIQATSLVQKGGKIILTGQGASVKVSGTVDASGKTGGGDINIGGSYRGEGPLANASKVDVTKNAVVKADATDTGNGGNIVVWSDDETSANGNFSVQGGPNGGNGGLVETSSKKVLNVTGAVVNALAPKGTVGGWLLDPENIIFRTTGVSYTGLPATGLSIVDVDTINAALANVVITATDSITFQADIDIAAAGVNLTLLAGEAATNPGETITGSYYDATGTLTSADFDSSTSTINMIGGRYIRTNGGNVSLFGANAVKINDGLVYTNGGDILITAGGIPIDNNTRLASGGGNVLVKAVKTDVTAGDVLSKNMTIDATGGTGPGGITLIENGTTLTGTLAQRELLYGNGNTFEESANSGTITVEGFTIGDNSNCFSAGGGSCVIADPNPPTAISVTLKAEDKLINYGDLDPIFTWLLFGTLQGGDSVTGALTRSAGSNVGTYAINQGTLGITGAGTYNLTFIPGTLTIAPAILNVTADAKSKIYGDADPALTYGASGFKNGDTSTVLTGALNRVAGENVGTYAINQGTVSAGGNYTINYTGNDLSITPATLNVVADAQVKTYGAPDPTLTYTATGYKNGDTSTVFTGDQARAAGENVGDYAINQGTLAAGGNYNINYTGANLTIDPYLLSVVADARSKTYGDVDPGLTFTTGTLQNGDTTSVFSGALSRAAGENFGIYGINQGTFSAGSNYTIDFTPANFNINKAILNVVADAKSKTFGTTDPALTYGATGFKNGDTDAVITGALSRDAGESVGNYNINQNTLDAGSNYTVNYTPANFAITNQLLSIIADNILITYGDLDPVLTYTQTGLNFGDTITGALTRQPGTNVGDYSILQGTLSAGANYTINYTPGTFTISPAILNVAADAKSKIYGDVDPVLTYGATGFKNGDTSAIITGALNRAVGENVGSYAIEQNTLSAGGNYTVNYTGANLVIDPATLNIATDAIFKVYGDVDPALTYGATGFKNGDTGAIITGALGRAAGENVGSYAIEQNTLSAGGNYTVNYTGNDLTINQAEISIIADAKIKIYGDADPALTYGATGFKNGDTSTVLSGGLTRQVGENVGAYAIEQGSLSAGANYAITYTGNFLDIDPRTLNVAADPQNKTYGSADPALTFTSDPLVNGDTVGDVFVGALTRDAGEDAGVYAVNQGTLDILPPASKAAPNYIMNFIGGTLTVNPFTLSVSANPASKDQGAPDPALTFATGPLQNGDTPSVFSGSLVRDPGEAGGVYNINQGSVSAGPNYTISYTGNLLTIVAAPAAAPNPAVPLFTAEALDRPIVSVANQAIEQDLPFEQFDTRDINTDVSISAAPSTGGAGSLAGLSPAAGGSAEDLAGLQPAAGGNDGEGNRQGTQGEDVNGNTECFNNFLSNKPCDQINDI